MSKSYKKDPGVWLLLSSLLLLVVFIVGRTVAGQDKIRVFITDSKSWEIRSGGAITDDGGFGGGGGGARPQTAEITKTFRERCPSLTVTNDKDKANYVVLLDHEGGKPLFLRDNKVVIYNKEGDVIFSNSTRSLGNAVKDACVAIEQDRPKQP